MPTKCTLYDTLETVCESYGAIAHLGERLFCKQEAVGSSPTGSTILERKYLRSSIRQSSELQTQRLAVRFGPGMPRYSLSYVVRFMIREGDGHNIPESFLQDANSNFNNFTINETKMHPVYFMVLLAEWFRRKSAKLDRVARFHYRTPVCLGLQISG